MKKNKYPKFEKYPDIKALWIAIGLFVLITITTTFLSPLNIYIKITIISTIGLFSLIFTLLFHELFIILLERELKLKLKEK